MYYEKEIKFSEYSDTFSIELADLRGIADCKVGHFGYNIWFRTPKAMKYGTYKNNKTMETAIIRTARKYGLTFEGWALK